MDQAKESAELVRRLAEGADEDLEALLAQLTLTLNPTLTLLGWGP